jgi:hypothetical protein
MCLPYYDLANVPATFNGRGLCACNYLSHGRQITEPYRTGHCHPFSVPAGATSNFWTLAYYQQFFDVDTTDVKNRLLYSMVPLPGKSFLEHHIRPRPDLYGPFWVCVTLVFSIAISGNVADFLQKSVALDDHNWHYDFHKVRSSPPPLTGVS